MSTNTGIQARAQDRDMPLGGKMWLTIHTQPSLPCPRCCFASYLSLINLPKSTEPAEVTLTHAAFSTLVILLKLPSVGAVIQVVPNEKKNGRKHQNEADTVCKIQGNVYVRTKHVRDDANYSLRPVRAPTQWSRWSSRCFKVDLPFVVACLIFRNPHPGPVVVFNLVVCT